MSSTVHNNNFFVVAYSLPLIKVGGQVLVKVRLFNADLQVGKIGLPPFGIFELLNLLQSYFPYI